MQLSAGISGPRGKNPNLAGVEDCDVAIRDELEYAGIEIVKETAKGEVPYSISGIHNGFTFRRAWYYWVVEGLVPLNVAELMYEDGEGRRNIRVMGNCTCPPPEEWAKWYTKDGREIAPTSHRTIMIRIFGRQHPTVKNCSYHLSDEPGTIDGAGRYIDLYHIDTRDGLKTFVEILVENGL